MPARGVHCGRRVPSTIVATPWSGEESGEQGGRDLGGALLVGEESGTLDHGELGVGEGPDHLARPPDGEERVLVAPDELYRHINAAVEVGQLGDVTRVEAAQHVDGGASAFGPLVEGAEEELVELAVEQGPVGERSSEHEPVAAQPSPCGHPAEPGAETRQVPRGEERAEARAQPPGLLGVDQAHRPQPAIARQCVPGDEPAAVVADHGDVVEVEEVHHLPDGADVLVDRQGRGGVEPAGPGAGQVDQVARHVVDQVRQQRPERGPAHRPSVDEEHVRAAADPPVGDLALVDVEEAVRLPAEEVRGVKTCSGHYETVVAVVATIKS